MTTVGAFTALLANHSTLPLNEAAVPAESDHGNSVFAQPTRPEGPAYDLLEIDPAKFRDAPPTRSGVGVTGMKIRNAGDYADDPGQSARGFNASGRKRGMIRLSACCPKSAIVLFPHLSQVSRCVARDAADKIGGWPGPSGSRGFCRRAPIQPST